jgi:kynurenine formamidase
MSISRTNSRPGFRIGRAFQTKRERRSTGTTSAQTTLGSGFFSELLAHVGQWGMHVDPPAHLAKGLRTIDQIDPKEMILPLVLVDVHREAAADPD